MTAPSKGFWNSTATITPITTGDFDMGSLLVSCVGALTLLANINLFRRGSVR
jgi:hypothetical protein